MFSATKHTPQQSNSSTRSGGVISPRDCVITSHSPHTTHSSIPTLSYLPHASHTPPRPYHHCHPHITHLITSTDSSSSATHRCTLIAAPTSPHLSTSTHHPPITDSSLESPHRALPSTAPLPPHTLSTVSSQPHFAPHQHAANH